jgi:hypothetical protein
VYCILVGGGWRNETQCSLNEEGRKAGEDLKPGDEGERKEIRCLVFTKK